jgi:hypothetical protein
MSDTTAFRPATAAELQRVHGGFSLGGLVKTIGSAVATYAGLARTLAGVVVGRPSQWLPRL